MEAAQQQDRGSTSWAGNVRKQEMAAVESAAAENLRESALMLHLGAEMLPRRS